MKTLLRLFTIGFFALSIAACARQPPPPDADLTPPPRKPMDAKTALESGRYR